MVLAECSGRVDADGAGRFLPHFRQRRQFRVDLVEARPGGRQQALAGLGRRDGAGGAGQEPEPEPFLEPPDRMAQRGLRHPEAGGGARKAALPRHGDEGDQVVGDGRRIHEFCS